MATESQYPPNWIVLPGSSLTAELTKKQESDKPVIEIYGNRQGLASLGNLLLWVSTSSTENESLSITGLPFVNVKSALSFTVVQPELSGSFYGIIKRVDKAEQFHWLINSDLLQKEAIDILDVSYTPDGYSPDHIHGRLSSYSYAELLVYRAENT
ncbi:MAG: hypothetical protein ACYTBX_14520 [Planctomycetota bacterium]|jgi:hypothetical protein